MQADTSVRSGIGEAATAAVSTSDTIGSSSDVARGARGVVPLDNGIGEAPPSAGQPGVGEAGRTVALAAQQAALPVESPSVESHSGAAAAAEAPAEAGTESQGQDARRDRNRSRRRDEQGGNGRDQRRERSDNRESREPAAVSSGRNGQAPQGGQGASNRPDSRPDNRADSRPDNRADSRPDSRADSRPDNRADNRADDDDDRGGRRGRDRFRNRNRRRGDRQGGEPETVIADDDVLVPIAGILDVLENYAFVRTTGYLPGSNDVYVSLSQVRKHGLRKGDVVEGAVRQPRDGERREKFNALVRLDKVNGLDPEESVRRPEFSKLVPLYPQDRLRLENDPTNMATRIIDLISPIGKGQRGLIVSPPKAGKTMILQAIANAITKNNPECHLMVVLVDERPEEVTDMQRTVKGEVIHSTF
ncbi:MAG: transcription termination factor Rho, partial [Trebonia sp.]